MTSLTRRSLVMACVAAWSLIVSAAAAQTPASEDIPVPGGTIAMARALGISPVPDRPRFLAELVRVLYDTPEGANNAADARIAKLTAYVSAVGRFQAALASTRANASGFSLAMAESDRASFNALLDLAGLRLLGKSKPFRVELSNDKRAAERARQLSDVAIDATEIAKQLNAGETARIDLPVETVPVPLGSAIWSDTLFRRPVPSSMLFAAVVSDRRAAMLSVGLAALDDETIGYLADNPALLRFLYEEQSGSFAAFGEALRIRGGRVVPPGGAPGLAIWEAALDAKAASPDRFVRELFSASHGRIALMYAALTHLDAPHVRFALGSWMQDPQAGGRQFKALLDASAAHTDWDAAKRPFARPTHDVAMMLARVRVEADGAPAPPASRVFWRRAFDGIDVPDDPARLLKNLREEGVVDAGWLAQNVCVMDVRVRGERLDQLSFAQRVFAATPEAALPDALVAVRSLPRFRMLMLTLERMGVKDPRVYASAARQAGQLTSLSGRRAFVAFGQLQGALAVLARLARVHRLPTPVIEALTASLLAQPFAGGAYSGAIARWMDRSLRPALQWTADADVDEELVRALAGVEAPAESLPRVAWEGRTYRIDFVTPERSRLTRAREKMGSPSVGAALEMAHAGAAPGKADEALAQALMSLAYAIDIGDPDGTALLGGDPSGRHDFGLTTGAADARLRAAWAEPSEISMENARHLIGSLLGLDVGMSALALRRINVGSLPPAPTLTMPERQSFVKTLALMNPLDLNDADRDAIVAAIGRGRARVAAIESDAAAWNAAADELGMDGWRRRAGRWTIAHDAEALPTFLSLSELAALGTPPRDLPFDRWGASGLAGESCLCLIAPTPGRVAVIGGRPQAGLIATQIADLNLRIAERLKAVSLPASLAPAVLAAAMQDFVDRANPIHQNDWLTLVRVAQAIPDDRVDDYVAALTSGGPLVLDRPAVGAAGRSW